MLGRARAPLRGSVSRVALNRGSSLAPRLLSRLPPAKLAGEMLRFARQFRRPLRAALATLSLACLSLTAMSCGGGDGADYGSVRIKFRVGNGVDADELFEQTKTVVLAAPYNKCTREYYEGEGADKLFVTPDGDQVMEEWKKRICAKSDPSDTGRAADKFLECDEDNVKLVQKMEAESPYMELRITMDSRSEARGLSERDIRIGPVPTEALTGCKSGFNFQTNGIQGLDRNKRVVWKALSDDVGTESPSPKSARAYTVTVGAPN